MNRRKLTTLDKLKIIVEQATCPLCKQKLGALDGLQFDHHQALARGGEDTNENLRALHIDCHAVKTRGSGATTRGSDIGEIAKTRRLVEAREARESAEPEPELLPTPPRLRVHSGKRKIPSRPFAKGKRPFPKRTKP